MSSAPGDVDKSQITRRALLAGGTALIGSVAAIAGGKYWFGQPATRVTTLAASGYEADLVDLLRRGIADYPATVARFRGGKVVLKPNLVEYNQKRPINTEPRLVAAAVEAFRKLGAREVVVAEGPGHRRDTELVVHESGLEDALAAVGAPFVDLNVDTPHELELPLGYMNRATLSFAETVLTADLLVSVAKMKTHHWAGATLTMKNLFGTVPSAVVGWPKNVLHQAGVEPSILDIWGALKPGFGIIDGIVGMEGDGPIMGTPVPFGGIFLGDSLPSVDATCARHMGLDPHKMPYIAVTAKHGGTVSDGRIEVVGDRLARRDFAVLDDFRGIRL